jgi:hypothetical protein
MRNIARDHAYVHIMPVVPVTLVCLSACIHAFMHALYICPHDRAYMNFPAVPGACAI